MKSTLLLLLSCCLAFATRPKIATSPSGIANLPSPSEIRVSGAGRPEMNGTYIRQGLVNGAPMYRHTDEKMKIWYCGSHIQPELGQRTASLGLFLFGVPDIDRTSQLLDGWRECTTDDGQSYYHHAETNTTQWERPMVSTTGTSLHHGKWRIGRGGFGSTIRQVFGSAYECLLQNGGCPPIEGWQVGWTGVAPVPKLELIFPGDAAQRQVEPLRQASAARPDRRGSLYDDSPLDNASFALRHAELTAITASVKAENLIQEQKNRAHEMALREQIQQSIIDQLSANIAAHKKQTDQLALESTLYQRRDYADKLYYRLQDAAVKGKTVECNVGPFTYTLQPGQHTHNKRKPLKFERQKALVNNVDGTAGENWHDSFTISPNTPLRFEVNDKTAEVVTYSIEHEAYTEEYGSATQNGLYHPAWTEEKSEVRSRVQHYQVVYDIRDGWTVTADYPSYGVYERLRLSGESFPVKITVDGKCVWSVINPLLSEEKRHEITKGVIDELTRSLNTTTRTETEYITHQ